MNEAPANASFKRNVDIDSAIDQSSFQVPVLIAISAGDDEKQVAKTFATAHEVFGYVFSVFLDPRRQCRAAEAVERLIPKSAHLTSSHDTEYVLVVHGKAIFWFTGAAAKRAAGSRLVLEHAHELAEAEQTPFYVLNSPTKKRRAAIIATGLAMMIPAVLLFKPFVTSLAGELNRYQKPSASPHPIDPGKRRPDRQQTVAKLDIDANAAGAGRSAGLSPTAHIPSRHGPPSRASDPKPEESQNSTTVSQYAAQMARFARSWPDYFDDRLLFSYWYFNEVTTTPTSVSVRPGAPQAPPAPTVAERRASVSDPGMAEQTPVPDEKTT